MKNFPTICIDNFFDDPDSIRDYALTLDYEPCPEGTFPGLRSQPVHLLNMKLLTMLCKRLFSTYYDLKQTPVQWEITSYFQKIYPMPGTAKFKNTGWIHADTNTVLAGLIYLNKTPNLDSGTSIYTMKEDKFHIEKSKLKHAFFKGESVDPDAYDREIEENNSAFSENARFNNVYNRLIAYDGELYHGANNFDSGEEFRLTQVFFIKNVLAQYTPIPRMKEYLF